MRLVTRKNADRAATLKRLFEEAGCSGDLLHEQPVKKKPPNLICTLPGQTDTVILVGAHFDHADLGMGAVDNWSGAALLPTLFQSVRNVNRRHTFVFVGFTEEEKGLVGSSFFVEQLTPEGTAEIRLMINLDSLGLGPANVWMSRSDKDAVLPLVDLARAMRLPIAGVDADKVGDEDSAPFRKRGVPAVVLHSITQETLSILHSVRDKLSAIKLDNYYDTYRLLSAYLVYLDELPAKPD